MLSYPSPILSPASPWPEIAHRYTSYLFFCDWSPDPQMQPVSWHYSLAWDFTCMFGCRCRQEWYLGICVHMGVCLCVKNVSDSEVMGNRIPFLFYPRSQEIPANEGEVGHTLWGWPELLMDGWAVMTQKSGIKLTISVQKWWSSLSCCAGEWAKLLISVPVTIYWSS